jgi:hypothetical protein
MRSFCAVGGACHDRIFVYQRISCHSGGGSKGNSHRNQLETYGGRTSLRNRLCHSDFRGGNFLCGFDRCTAWNSDCGISGGVFRKEAGRRHQGCGGIAGWNSFRDLRAAGTLFAESSDVPAGEKAVFGFRYPSIYRRGKPALGGVSAGGTGAANSGQCK